MKIHAQRVANHLLATAFLSVILLARAAMAQSEAPPQGVLPVPALTGYKVALRFLQDKVAAGAIENCAHQAAFEVFVTDAANKPQAGVRVPLPIIAQGGRGPKKGEISARVAWQGTALADGSTLTDAKGLARGLFTSGHRTESTVLQMPGRDENGAKASIEQVWNEVADGEEWIDDEGGNPLRDVYKLRYQPGIHKDGAVDKDHWEPITGHHARLDLTKLTISTWHPERGPDEDGDGEPDGQHEEKKIASEDIDRKDWDYYSKFVTLLPVQEVGPGLYACVLSFNIPKTPEGEDLFTIDHWSYDIVDDDSYDIGGASDAE